MKSDVEKAVAELGRQFAPSQVHATEDGSGGAHVIVETVDLGNHYEPRITWMGGHLTAQYPYADVYPVFIGAEVRRTDGTAFEAPITIASFVGKPAWQVSRRSPTAVQDLQTATSKFLKVLHYLGSL